MTSISDSTKHNEQENAVALNAKTLPKVTKPTDEEILRHKLSLAEAGFNVSLDPDEAERAEDMGWEACSLEQAIAEGYDPNGDNFSQEEIEDTVNNGDYAEIATGLLDKVTALIIAKLRTIRSKEEAFFDLSAEDKKEFDKLNCTIDEIELLQKQIPSNPKAENHSLIIEWGKLLNAGDDYESLWERLEKEAEKGRRRKAIEGAVASFELEGLHQSEEEKALNKRFINLELTEEEFIQEASKIAKGEENALCRLKILPLL